MSIIEAVRSFLRTCPLLAGERLNVDFLPEEAKTYSIDVVPCRAILELSLIHISEPTRP